MPASSVTILQPKHPLDLSQDAGFLRNNRLIYFGLIVVATLTLIVARFLHPSAKGYGTHQQLGLPPCAFFELTAIPCPSCGLTTSFAYAAHFQFFQALVTQPFGLISFCLTAISIPIFLCLLRWPVSWLKLIQAHLVRMMFYVLLFLYFFSWVYKIFMVKMHTPGS